MRAVGFEGFRFFSWPWIYCHSSIAESNLFVFTRPKWWLKQQSKYEEMEPLYNGLQRRCYVFQRIAKKQQLVLRFPSLSQPRR